MFLEYMLIYQVFRTLFKALKQPLPSKSISVCLALIICLCHYQRYDKQNPCQEKLRKCKLDSIKDLNTNIVLLGSICKKDQGSQLEIAESMFDTVGVYVTQTWSWFAGSVKTINSLEDKGVPTLENCMCILTVLPIYWMLHWHPHYMVHTAGFHQAREKEKYNRKSDSPKRNTVYPWFPPQFQKV
eukprot:UN23662